MAFRQDSCDNGCTNLTAIATVFHRNNKCQRQIFVRNKAGEHGIGLLVAADLRGTGFGTDLKPRETIVTIKVFHVVA